MTASGIFKFEFWYVRKYGFYEQSMLQYHHKVMNVFWNIDTKFTFKIMISFLKIHLL